MEIIILEKKDFANLVCRHRKCVFIIEFLTFLTNKIAPMDITLGADEVVKIFDISMNQLRSARRAGIINGYSSNGKIYYKAADIIDYIYKIDSKKIRKTVDNLAQDEYSLNKYIVYLSAEFQK